ncbi:hypothetical protein SPRG_02877 [Saprolegnia parasitica CBS 223.65]|uniref:Uncharacterized protein n=1 Tax=Saprolegnia parasitica (strain CBS 223.65) TaxID=695850 RepID=A0A067CT21_SAPPC|nr:hypothetical protein SPRG_02877 [Saprolegnia parasitica CBS 223.65]KDO32400.1 hypothetical protein SPRG_02877 [Saprolegnia parasitica CBS 223.65]|eukprot:XP_012196854.1 hypothetical protein SPRG_02877 [Saprolegnia parasitica CBS 223.65]
MNSDKAFQDASHEYLLARQRMNEKVNRCKEIELKMQQTLREIQAAYSENNGESLAKTVGTLHLSIHEVAGETIENAVVKVHVEPESIPDFEELDESADEVKNQVAWTGEFPANFVFDGIQSREAVVHITVGEDDEEKEPIKVITFPIAALFRDDMKKWFHLVDEVVAAVEEAAVVEEVEAAEEVAAEEPATAEATVQVASEDEHVTEAGEPSSDKVDATDAEATEEVADAEVAEEATTEAGETTEKETTNEEVVEEAAAGEQEANVQAASEEVVAEEAAVVVEAAEEAAVVAADVAEEEASPSEETHEAAADVVEAVAVVEEVVVVEDTSARVHVHASFVLSEIEALAQKAIALSKEKNEMDIEIRMCDQELSSARIRYERLKASQKAALGSSAATMKNKLSIQRAPPKPKSLYERATAAVGSTFTPQRRSLAWSVTFFVVVSAFFHTNGDELII